LRLVPRVHVLGKTGDGRRVRDVLACLPRLGSERRLEVRPCRLAAQCEDDRPGAGGDCGRSRFVKSSRGNAAGVFTLHPVNCPSYGTRIEVDFLPVAGQVWCPTCQKAFSPQAESSPARAFRNAMLEFAHDCPNSPLGRFPRVGPRPRALERSGRNDKGKRRFGVGLFILTRQYFVVRSRPSRRQLLQ
jgi:hypothetical protein